MRRRARLAGHRTVHGLRGRAHQAGAAAVHAAPLVRHRARPHERRGDPGGEPHLARRPARALRLGRCSAPGACPRFMAKSTLFKGRGLVGTVMRGARQIPVHRHTADASAALRDAVAALQRRRVHRHLPRGHGQPGPGQVADGGPHRHRPARPAVRRSRRPGRAVGRRGDPRQLPPARACACCRRTACTSPPDRPVDLSRVGGSRPHRRRAARRDRRRHARHHRPGRGAARRARAGAGARRGSGRSTSGGRRDASGGAGVGLLGDRLRQGAGRRGHRRRAVGPPRGAGRRRARRARERRLPAGRRAAGEPDRDLRRAGGGRPAPTSSCWPSPRRACATTWPPSRPRCALAPCWSAS